MTATLVNRDPKLSSIRAIAIGGSAGALDVMRVLLPALPSSLSIPVFLVLHIASDAPTHWGAIFRSASLRVEEAEDKQMALPGAAYFAPPGYHLLVDRRGRMALSTDAPVHSSRPAIDVLFESAAWAYGGALLGVILSGANADGAAGLAAIHGAGGICWVQSPEEASIGTMPRAALHAVHDARVLTASEMRDQLQTLSVEPR